MIATTEQFVLDENGHRTGVLMSLQRYYELLEAQEELEANRKYDEAKAGDDEVIPFDQAVREIEVCRQ